MTNYLDFWSTEGYECDETDKAQALMPQQEMLMKMFAVSYNYNVSKEGTRTETTVVCHPPIKNPF